MAQTQKTRYAILGALTVMPMSGYDLKKWINDVTGPFWAESPGRVYPMLANLVREELLTCDDSQGCGKRPKKIYKITAKGRRILQQWLVKPTESVVMRNELVLKLFYGSNLSSEQYLTHLKNHREKMLAKKKEHVKIMKHIKTKHANLKDAYFWLLTLKKAQYHVAAELKWCQEMIKLFSRT